ncbi:MAG: 5-dehydro-4-deoxy-D-glucuronate isomerase [Prolixibacteraceae bacterium]|jgi:4-deoxy-L-threo-5-hexosulose-uronate ketol-isomerase|nr:5-dehydro-4-deoxy-D-glucuronate isomerase [Prolixibacteraceae bacterium]MBT6005664.1 5-dehydro-4-deoxy-D-glucuronate isomerase [Prolixibacteraceae bacterium]MBT6764259.1 5-dehydro-4-deoxy-D-glucuronate isomerase [Prolixibacteraceae bacterium]MBT7000182.1 5-dehydro-4-deoxy-D-glucuronate isomerase [Prolixibacteraceae bacterium]MBT7396227.1 5-dehydro-4-deoxy-D-glucuronate isomerase [Prolixibacteraceae bacterium]
MATIYEERSNYHPEDFKSYGTERIREEFLVEKVMDPGNIRLVYSLIERYIVGGAVPVETELVLETIEPLKAEYFCERREVGVINVAGSGSIVVDGTEYKMEYKDALYIGKGSKVVVFKSDDPANPAHFYINSAPAHKEFPVKHVTLGDANVLHLGALETSNERNINQLLISGVVETCQLQMGMTELKTGSVWNTMPPHLHSRRNEVYFYFDVPEGQAICHFMGQPDETRHIWMKNEQAVISPSWSIHSAAGTSNYIFIWGMAGENLDYTDMDVIKPKDLR